MPADRRPFRLPHWFGLYQGAQAPGLQPHLQTRRRHPHAAHSQAGPGESPADDRPLQEAQEADPKTLRPELADPVPSIGVTTMSRCKDAPFGFQCPFRDKCPHLDNHSTTWVMEVYQEAFDLRRRLNLLELDSQKRIDELGKALLERDAKIAQLRLEHQKQFKANVKKPPIK